MENITTLLFDYGGTLDTGACHWSYVIEEGYRQAGINLNEANFRAAYVYAERALAKSPIIQPDFDFKRLMEEKVNLEFKNLEEEGIYKFTNTSERNKSLEIVAAYCNDFARKHVEESAEILKVLKTRYELIMVSNFYGNLSTILLTYGIADLFETIIESSVVGVRKPDPAIWQLGVDAAHCNAGATVAIGDSFTKDIVPAKSIGCNTIWYKGREWEEKQYDESLPTQVITTLEELANLL